MIRIDRYLKHRLRTPKVLFLHDFLMNLRAKISQGMKSLAAVVLLELPSLSGFKSTIRSLPNTQIAEKVEGILPRMDFDLLFESNVFGYDI